MDYSVNSLKISFLNLAHYYFKKDTISFDTGVNAPVNFKLSKLPYYACGVYLTWNDKNLDYRLPKFVGCGEVVTGGKLQEMYNSNNDCDNIIFGAGKLDVNINEALMDKYIDDSFLLINAKFKSNNKLYIGKYVYWHLDDLDLVFNKPEEVVNYINFLPYKVKVIKQFNILPIQ